MFPKAISAGRSRLGSVSGTIGEAKEKYDGNSASDTSSLMVTVNDPSDVLQGEYWNGSAWVEATDTEISNIPYAVGVNVRYRIKNSFFNQNSSYVTGTAGSDIDTGGYVAYSTTLQGLGTIIDDATFVMGTDGAVTASCTIPAGMVGKKIRCRVYGTVFTYNPAPHYLSTLDIDTYQDVTSTGTTVNFSFDAASTNEPYQGSVNYQFFAVYVYFNSGPVAQGNITSGTFGI